MSDERKEQKPESILERLKRLDPNRNVAFVAIEQLTDPEEMRQFMAEYIGLLSTSDDEGVRENAAQVAGSNIGYVIGYYGKETSDRWLNTLEGLSHPIFGRNIPYNDPNKARQIGEMSGRIEQSKN